MSDSPFRERRISADEARRVVKRAAELAAIEPQADVGQALTVAELEERLADLGIGPEITRRAMQAGGAPPKPSPDGALRVERELVVDGELAPERFDAITDTVAAAMKIPGRMSAVGSTLTWTPAGPLIEPKLTIRSEDGQTRIRYVETVANAGQQVFGFGALSAMSGLFTGLLGAFIAAFVAKGVDIGVTSAKPAVLAVGCVVGVAMAIATFIGFKRLLAQRAERRGTFADDALLQVGQAVRAAGAAKPTKARVAANAADTELEVAEQSVDEFGVEVPPVKEAKA